MRHLDLNNPIITLTGEEFLPKQGITFAQQVLDYFIAQGGVAQSPLDYYSTGRKKQLTGMMAAPILIGDNLFICVVVVIYNLQKRRLYLHETFLTEKIPEIAASSLVHSSTAASPQSQGNIAKILQSWIKSK